MTQPVIFLDDGGVMNDNLQRGMQWPPLVAEFFVPRLGGTADAWAEANRIVITRTLELEAWSARLRAAANYIDFDRTYQYDWLHAMCMCVGVSTPAKGESIELAHQAEAYIIRRVHSAFPGAIDAIHTLHNSGYTLHTASGESSFSLVGYLEGMGVRNCFGRLYGPDLIDSFKESPAYYERIFIDSGIAPSTALIVDDSPLAISWATKVGARTVLINSTQHNECGATLCIRSLAELPGVIGQFHS